MTRAEIDAALLADHGDAFLLTALVDKPVYAAAGKDLGKCHDVWATRTGPRIGAFGPALRVDAVIVGTASVGDRLGYHLGDVEKPWLLSAFFKWLHRSARVVHWDAVARVDAKGVHLRPRAAVERANAFDRDRRGDGLFLGLRVLDSEIVDSNGRSCGVVDDLELKLARGNAAPYVASIRTGPGALAHRIGGRAGLWLESLYKRVRPADAQAPVEISFDAVREIGNHVQLAVPRSDLDVTRFEEWVLDRVISKIPGAPRGRGS